LAIKRIGKRTFRFENPPVIAGFAAVVGKKEGQGPLASYFDKIIEDPLCGTKSFEKAECVLQQQALEAALSKAKWTPESLHFLLGGDLLNQCIATTYALRGTAVPFLGLYGACSTMAESILLAAMTVDGGWADRAAAITSSHFCTAERQYRLPLEYGGQRTPTAQWTATASGTVLLTSEGTGPRVTMASAGVISDLSVSDLNNMGAAMAPAAYETLSAFFEDTNTRSEDYDRILTGDLGKVGSQILRTLFEQSGKPLAPCYEDCGVLLFDDTQDTHAGGSGCGCSAAVLCSTILQDMQKGKLKKILFAGTGALHSPTAAGQGESVPGICHLVQIECGKEG